MTRKRQMHWFIEGRGVTREEHDEFQMKQWAFTGNTYQTIAKNGRGEIISSTAHATDPRKRAEEHA